MTRLGRKDLADPRPSRDRRSETGNARRTLLLVLLLVVVAAGAVFLLFPDLLAPPESPPPAPPEVKRQTINLTPPTSAPAEQQAAAPAPAQAQPGAPPEPADAAPPPEQATQTVPPPAASAPEAAPAAPQAVEAAAPPVPVAKQEPATAPQAAPAMKDAQSGGVYTLQAGAFLLESNLQEATRTIRELGFEPRSRTGQKHLEMIRLKVAGYAEETAARTRAGELQRGSAPDAFVVYEEPEWVVYAGSFQNLDRARSFADRLFAAGLRTSETRSQVALPITILRFGDFATKADAEAVLGRARAAGLEPLLVKVR